MADFLVHKSMLHPLATDQHALAVCNILTALGYKVFWLQDLDIYPNPKAANEAEDVDKPSDEDWKLATDRYRKRSWEPIKSIPHEDCSEDIYIIQGHAVSVTSGIELSDRYRANAFDTTVLVKVDGEDIDGFSPVGSPSDEVYTQDFLEKLHWVFEDIERLHPYPWADSKRPFVVTLDWIGIGATPAIAKSMVRLLELCDYDVIYLGDVVEDPNLLDPSEGYPEVIHPEDMDNCRKWLHNNYITVRPDYGNTQYFVVNGHVVTIEYEGGQERKDTLDYTIRVDDMVYDKLAIPFATDTSESQEEYFKRYKDVVEKYLHGLVKELPSLWHIPPEGS